MTRKETLNKYAHKITTKDELINYCNIINEIYDDFENRTCKNCIYYTLLGICNLHSNWLTFEPSSDFGCIRWEDKRIGERDE